MSTSLQQIIGKIKGRMALSTQYEVIFDMSGADPTLIRALNTAVGTGGINSFNKDSLISLMCSEAQLPNVSSLTGQTQGVYLGENQVNYAYGRLFTDISLGWQCDANMTPMKFLQEWNNYIYKLNGSSSGKSNQSGNLVYNVSTEGAVSTAVQVVRGYPTRVSFPKDYQGKIKITKVEMGPGGVDRRIMCYTLLNAFPHSIDATPLSYGSSQVVNVSASFYYSSYTVSYLSKNI